MTKESVSQFFKGVGGMAKKNAPGILTGLGIFGMGAAVVLAVKATPKALELIEEERSAMIGEATLEEAQEWSKEGGVPLTPVDYVKICWKPYIPAIATFTVSAICLAGASNVSARRNAALTAAYKLSETALKEFKEKAAEVVGEKKVQEIKHEIAKDKMEKKPASKSEVIVLGKGDTLCYDVTSDRYFKSDIEKIKKAINEANRRMLLDNYISLTELYSEIGLKTTSLSDSLGWNVIHGYIEPEFSSQLADDGTPCMVVDYKEGPYYNFDTFA